MDEVEYRRIDFSVEEYGELRAMKKITKWTFGRIVTYALQVGGDITFSHANGRDVGVFFRNGENARIDFNFDRDARFKRGERTPRGYSKVVCLLSEAGGRVDDLEILLELDERDVIAHCIHLAHISITAQNSGKEIIVSDKRSLYGKYVHWADYANV